MAHGEYRTNPQMIGDLMSNIARVLDRAPDELAALHDKVIEQLENGPKVDERDPWKHVAEHFSHVFPAVMSDSEMREAGSHPLVQEYGKLPATPDTRLAQDGQNSIAGAVFLGLATGALIGGIIVGYCLGGEDPAPGESVEVRC